MAPLRPGPALIGGEANVGGNQATRFFSRCRIGDLALATGGGRHPSGFVPPVIHRDCAGSSAAAVIEMHLGDPSRAFVLETAVELVK